MNGDNKNINETDGDPVSNAVSRLGHVSAPANFEDSVMRAIRLRAESKPRAGYAWLKIALPAAALLLLAAFFGLSSLSTADISPVEVADEQQVQDAVAPPELDGSSNALRVAQNGNSLPNKELSLPRSNSANSQPPIQNSRTLDLALPSEKDGTLPKGFEANRRSNQSASDAGIKTTVRAVDVLQMVGVRSENRGGEFIVIAVADASASARVGVQPGDVVVAVNDVPVTSNATIPGGAIQSLRVRRNGQTITLRF